jgi:Replication initiator protein A
MMPETDPPEPTAHAWEVTSRILRPGKDEMNLAEFPITRLTDRVPKGQKILEYQDQIYDERIASTITRKLTISASEAYGLPTAVDDDVILALIQLTKLANGFTSCAVEFNRLDLIKILNWPDSGFSYKRLGTSLKRWLGVSLVYENAWWERRQQSWTTQGFHILDNFELNDGRTAGVQGELFPSKIIWNRAVFESFEAGYLKTIDYGLYFKLEHPTAKRMYRFLSKRMYHRPDWTFDLRDFAFEHVGLSRNYTDNGKLKEKLQPGIEELEAAGFLEPMSKDDRYQKEGRSWKIRLVQANPALLAPAATR